MHGGAKRPSISSDFRCVLEETLALSLLGFAAFATSRACRSVAALPWPQGDIADLPPREILSLADYLSLFASMWY